MSSKNENPAADLVVGSIIICALGSAVVKKIGEQAPPPTPTPIPLAVSSPGKLDAFFLAHPDFLSSLLKFAVIAGLILAIGYLCYRIYRWVRLKFADIDIVQSAHHSSLKAKLDRVHYDHLVKQLNLHLAQQNKRLAHLEAELKKLKPAEAAVPAPDPLAIAQQAVDAALGQMIGGASAAVRPPAEGGTSPTEGGTR